MHACMHMCACVCLTAFIFNIWSVFFTSFLFLREYKMIGGAQINSNKKRSVHVAEWLGYRKHTFKSVQNAYKSERTAFYNIWTRLKRTLAATAKQQQQQRKSGSHLLYYMCLRLVYIIFPNARKYTHALTHNRTFSRFVLVACRYGTGPHTAAEAAAAAANKYVVWLCTHVLCATQHRIFAFPSHTHSLTVSFGRSFVRIKLQSSFSTGIFPWFLIHFNSVETCARSSRKSVFYFVVFSFWFSTKTKEQPALAKKKRKGRENKRKKEN